MNKTENVTGHLMLSRLVIWMCPTTAQRLSCNYCFTVWESHHALLPFPLRCFWIFYPVVFVNWHKMMNAWWVLVVCLDFFIVYNGIFWEVLISCYILFFLCSSSLLLSPSFFPTFFFYFSLYPQIHLTPASKPKHMAATGMKQGRVMKKETCKQ